MSLDPVSAIFNVGEKLIDRLWPNPTEREAAKLRLFELQQTGELAKLGIEKDLAIGQMAINKQEASHTSIFVAGWRPFIGWVCGSAFAYHFIIQPLLAFLFAASGHSVILPAFEMGELTTVLIGILGLGVFRTTEKIKGVTK